LRLPEPRLRFDELRARELRRELLLRRFLFDFPVARPP
jgi:hypothetical protein